MNRAGTVHEFTASIQHASFHTTHVTDVSMTFSEQGAFAVGNSSGEQRTGSAGNTGGGGAPVVTMQISSEHGEVVFLHLDFLFFTEV